MDTPTSGQITCIANNLGMFKLAWDSLSEHCIKGGEGCKADECALNAGCWHWLLDGSCSLCYLFILSYSICPASVGGHGATLEMV